MSLLKCGTTEERQALKELSRLEDKAMAGDKHSETTIKNLSTTEDEEKDEEQDIFIKNVELWINTQVEGDMAEKLVRTESKRNRCRIGLKLVVKNIKTNLKKEEMQIKKEMMYSVQKMGKELDNMLRNYGFTDQETQKLLAFPKLRQHSIKELESHNVTKVWDIISASPLSRDGNSKTVAIKCGKHKDFKQKA